MFVGYEYMGRMGNARKVCRSLMGQLLIKYPLRKPRGWEDIINIILGRWVRSVECGWNVVQISVQQRAIIWLKLVTCIQEVLR
jgi:hypothetical protein